MGPCRIRRWILYGGGHHEVTNVIESHQGDDEPAEHVQRRHSVRPAISVGAAAASAELTGGLATVDWIELMVTFPKSKPC